MTINYINIGRNNRSWSKSFGNEVTEDQIAKEAKRNGGIMSSEVDAEMNDSASGGEIIISGWRSVGTFTISR